jgi:asparagine synthase (glutamine-hydrolysing)
LRGLFAPAEVERLLRHWGLQSFATSDQGDLSTPSIPIPQGDINTFAEQADAIAWAETSLYMQQQLLRDSDCFSMAHGLELRLPFVDAVFFRSVADISANIRTMPDKQLLRRALPELMAAMAPAPKQGFSFPFQQWFNHPSSPLLPGSNAFPLPPIPASLDLSSWARRWGLMVMHHWLRDHLDLELV